jgi:hypothetical protein
MQLGRAGGVVTVKVCRFFHPGLCHPLQVAEDDPSGCNMVPLHRFDDCLIARMGTGRRVLVAMMNPVNQWHKKQDK